MSVRRVDLDLDGSGLRVGVAVAEWNGSITGPLADGTLERLAELGVAAVKVARVPGASELPVVARSLAAGHDAVVAIGVVIEGETDHYTHIATQATRGLTQVSLDTGVPVANALLTVRDVAHAVERSVPGDANKGREAAEAAVATANLLRELGR